MVKQVTDLEKTLKGKEEKSRKLEKEYKKVWLIYNQMDRYVSCDPPPSLNLRGRRIIRGTRLRGINLGNKCMSRSIVE